MTGSVYVIAYLLISLFSLFSQLKHDAPTFGQKSICPMTINLAYKDHAGGAWHVLGACIHKLTRVSLGSAQANGRGPKGCLGPVFNFKLGCFA